MIPSVPARICYSYFKLAGSFKVSMAHENGSKIQENSIKVPLQCHSYNCEISVITFRKEGHSCCVSLIWNMLLDLWMYSVLSLKFNEMLLILITHHMYV